jgi:putative redox protein
MSQETVKAALMKSIAGIQSNPGAAKVVFRAETQLEEDVRCSAKVRDFAPIIVDEPPDLGGADAAANPVELLLVALGACQEIMYSAYASVMGVQLNSVKVNLRGYLDLRGLFGMDEAIPPGYQKIIFETQLNSPADMETLKKLVETVESHCPVMDTLVRAIEVSGQVSINGQLMEAGTVAA